MSQEYRTIGELKMISLFTEALSLVMRYSSNAT